MSVPVIRPLQSADRPAWEALYRAYGEFYEQPKSERDLDALWPRVFGDAAELEAYVALLDDERPIGLVHVREFARPLHGSRGLYLDDLFVDTDRRGSGVARALLQHLSELAHARGLSVVRWVTAPDNATARGLYDQVADLSPFVTYDLGPAAGS